MQNRLIVQVKSLIVIQLNMLYSEKAPSNNFIQLYMPIRQQLMCLESKFQAWAGRHVYNALPSVYCE